VTGIFYLLVVLAEMFGLGRQGIPGFTQQSNPLSYLTSRYWSPSAVWAIELVVVLAGLGLSVVLVYLAVNVAVIRAFRTEFRDEFGLWRHLLVPATAIVLFLFPLWGILHPRAHQLADLLHFTALGWVCLGVIDAVILQARRPSSFETLGRVFMPADGQSEYSLESAGDLVAGLGGQRGSGAQDGDGDA
jgi:hypothetical protein